MMVALMRMLLSVCFGTCLRTGWRRLAWRILRSSWIVDIDFVIEGLVHVLLVPASSLFQQTVLRRHRILLAEIVLPSGILFEFIVFVFPYCFLVHFYYYTSSTFAVIKLKYLLLLFSV